MNTTQNKESKKLDDLINSENMKSFKINNKPELSGAKLVDYIKAKALVVS